MMTTKHRAVPILHLLHHPLPKAERAAVNAADGEVTLGFRAEDASVAETGTGQITAPIYTIELLGDAVMLAVRAGGQMVSVKAGKDYRAEIGDSVSFHVPPEICHVFDRASGQRLSVG